MKRFLFIPFLAIACSVHAQKAIVQKLPLTATNFNLLDAVTYRRAPINFVPFRATPDAAQKGFKMDSTYTWTDKAGVTHTATGAQIINQVNDVEKSLCARGHSLRHSNTFGELSATLPKNIGRDGIAKVPASFKGKRSSSDLYDRINRINRMYTIGGSIYPYLGSLQRSAEFPGTIEDVQNFTRLPNDATFFSLPIVLAAQPGAFSKIKTFYVDIYKDPARSGAPLFSIPADITNHSFTGIWPPQIQNKSANPPPQTRGMVVYNYNIPFRNHNNKIPPANYNHDYYYVGFRFIGNDGKPVLMSVENDIVLDNSLQKAITIPLFKEATVNGFNFEITDPVKHCFGFYARSNGFKAKTSSEPFGNSGKGINKKSSFTSDISFGAKYYNFGHLLNSNAPLTNDLEVVGINFSTLQNYYRDENAPGIRIPGVREEKDLLINPNTKLEYRVMGQVVSAGEISIYQEVFSQRFFIGPVPCRATIALKGKAGIATSGTYTDKTCNINGRVMPYAELGVVGSGGVDALIAYALVEVNVTLLNASLPVDFSINNGSAAAIKSALVLSGLAGSVNFRAGFCIPIPFFDDICKEFTVEIFSWSGVTKEYTIDNTGVN